MIDTAAHRFGWDESLWFETTVDDPGHQAAAQALDRSPDVLIVVGGDGTMRAMVEESHRAKIPITIVPTGTGNLLARNVRLPLHDPGCTVSAAFQGTDHLIDIVSAVLTHPDSSVSERIFVAMAGIGLDAGSSLVTSS